MSPSHVESAFAPRPTTRKKLKQLRVFTHPINRLTLGVPTIVAQPPDGSVTRLVISFFPDFYRLTLPLY